jgi:hypothetical protein
MKNDAKEYKINTVQDMIDATNPENLDSFLSDLKAVITSAHFIKSLVGSESEKIKSDGFIWADDGQNKIDTKINEK